MYKRSTSNLIHGFHEHNTSAPSATDQYNKGAPQEILPPSSLESVENNLDKDYYYAQLSDTWNSINLFPCCFNDIYDLQYDVDFILTASFYNFSFPLLHNILIDNR